MGSSRGEMGGRGTWVWGLVPALANDRRYVSGSEIEEEMGLEEGP
jgi:hypothetical protein